MSACVVKGQNANNDGEKNVPGNPGSGENTMICQGDYGPSLATSTYHKLSSYSRQIKQVRDESLESTRRMRNLTQEAQVRLEGGFGRNQQYVPRIFHDQRENEMEENIQSIESCVGNLQVQSGDIRAEVERQDRQLDRINKKWKKWKHNRNKQRQLSLRN